MTLTWIVASSGAVWGAFVNAGQACLSVERCYVHRKIYSAFLEACVRKTQQLKVGDGMDPATISATHSREPIAPRGIARGRCAATRSNCATRQASG